MTAHDPEAAAALQGAVPLIDQRRQTGRTSVIPGVVPVGWDLGKWTPKARVISVFVVFVGLVFAIWAPGVRERGLNYETTLVYDSQTARGLIGGYLWAGDDLRVFTTLFYHLSYVLAVATGNNGDYIFYQFVYAALWLGRAVVFFLLVRAIVPRYPLVAYAVGGLMIVHASDSALNWVGQLNQFGFMFWLVLSVYLLVRSLQSGRVLVRSILLGSAVLSEFLCLWSYESPLPIIVAVPFILFVAMPAQRRALFEAAAAWYFLPVLYVYLTLQKYLGGYGGYQESVVDKSLTLGGFLGSWAFHGQQSVSFWAWQASTPWIYQEQTANLVALFAAVAFAIGGILLVTGRRPAQLLPGNQELLVTLGVGCLVTLLSFPVYLLLANNTNLWRTQMLSGFGAALVLGAAALLVGRVVRYRQHGAYFSIVLAAVVVGFGVRAGERVGMVQEAGWEKHRAIMWQVVNLIPDVKTDTLIMLVGLPKAKDPFADAMWFDFPVRLSYPQYTVAGAIAYSDPGPTDRRWDFQPSEVDWNGVGYAPPEDLRAVTYDHVVFLGYGSDGRLTVLDRVPQWLLDPGVAASGAYDPHNVVSGVTPSDTNQRRFGR